MQVECIANPGDEWDAFVEAQPGATLAHAAAWAHVLRAAYGLSAHYLAVRAVSGALCGVLPLIEFRTLRGRREWVSLPYLDSGGVLTSSVEAEALLLTEAFRLAEHTRASAVELRQETPLSGVSQDLLSARVNMVLALAVDAETQWRALPAKVRNQTRKAECSGLALVPENEGSFEDFYVPFRVNMRDLGSPVHAKSFFAEAARCFGSRLRFVIARTEERCVGGLVAIHYAGRVFVPWASTLREERHRCPNNLIYWEALRWAIARGAQRFDFGRSPRDSGTYHFKRGWGAQEHPLYWFRVASDGKISECEDVRVHPILRRFSQFWQRLPVALATCLGPHLRRRLSN